MPGSGSAPFRGEGKTALRGDSGLTGGEDADARLGQTAVAAIVDLQLFAIPRTVLEVIAIRNTSEIAINCNRRRDWDEDLQLIAIDRSSDTTYPKRGTNSNWPLLPPCPCAERRHPTTTDGHPFGIQVEFAEELFDRVEIR